MLTLKIEDREMFDSVEEEFFTLPGGTFRFRHSLYSISNWESDFQKPFLTSKLADEDFRNYFMYMCLDEGLTKFHITSEVFRKLSDYIGDPRTATTVNRPEGASASPVASQSAITSEVIYSMMVTAGIPFEAEHWNLNRLLVLLEVISIKSNPDNKMSKDDIYKQNRDLNEQRKRELNTKG